MNVPITVEIVTIACVDVDSSDPAMQAIFVAEFHAVVAQDVEPRSADVVRSALPKFIPSTETGAAPERGALRRTWEIAGAS
jgi:hypothetical protein